LASPFGRSSSYLSPSYKSVNCRRQRGTSIDPRLQGELIPGGASRGRADDGGGVAFTHRQATPEESWGE